MAFLLLCLYMIFFLLRPHQWALQDLGDSLPIISVLLVLDLGLLLLLEKQKNFSVQFMLLLFLSVIIVLSGAINVSVMTGVDSLIDFIPLVLVPFLLFSNLVNTHKRHEIIMFLCVISSLIMVSNGVSQQNSEIGLGWAGSLISVGSRITYLGVLQDPNDLGGFFVLSLPFAAYFGSYGKMFPTRLFGKLSVVTILYGVYMTNSRGALLAAMAIMAVYFLYRYGKGKSMLLGALGAPVLLVIMSSFREIDSEEESAAGRTEAWFEGFQMLKSNPLFGVGRGQFVEHHYLTAHNSFVLVMAELGILGYCAWFTCLALSIYSVFLIHNKFTKYLKEHKFKVDKFDMRVRELAANSAIFYAAVGYFVTTFFLSRSYSPITFYLCGLAVAASYRIQKTYPDLKSESANISLAKMGVISVATMVGMNVVVKVLV